MKIRSDFVTNSSSSSYGAISITCKPLVDILEQYKSLINNRGLGSFPPPWTISWKADEGTIVWNWDEDGPSPSYVPHNVDEVLQSLLYALQDTVDGGIDVAPLGPLARTIVEHREDIEGHITGVFWQSIDQEWGDGESRIDKSSYSEERLQDIMQSIADEQGCSVDDLTDDDFINYAAKATSIDETIFEYDRSKDSEEYSHDYHLL